jgi:hypothetical protein
MRAALVRCLAGQRAAPPSGMTNPSRVPLIEPELTGSIIAAYYKVYNTLGTGYSEQFETILEEFFLYLQTLISVRPRHSAAVRGP